MAHNKARVATAVLAGSVLASGLGIAGAATAASAGSTGLTTSDVKIAAGHDAYTNSVRKTYNTGQSDKLVAGKTDGEKKISFLQFRVPALPKGGSVTRAKLKLVTDGHKIPGSVTLSRVADTAWSEKTLTAANAPAIGPAVVTVKAAGATSVSFDLSKVVTGPGAYAFAVTSSTTTDVARFQSAEAGKYGPTLTVTTTQPTTNPTTPPPTTTPTTPPPTTTPTTPPPTTTPTTPPPTTNPTTPPAPCKVDVKLVPTCGVLWGAAAGGFSDTPRDQAIKDWEKATGRTATIWHQYHKGDELFPTKAEMAMARDPQNPRVLLINWKVAEGTTWAKVASGAKNARIDRLAAYLKANFTEKFYLAPHHEPENEVVPTAGSGMTAKDYAAMYRHVVTRLKAQGVQNAINVVAYMGNEKWMAQSWWGDLYPGDDVVDWIGLDSYVNAQPGGYHYGDFADLLDRAPKGGGMGFYEWSTTKHPSKPLMIAEWGVYHSTTKPADKAAILDTVLPELKKRPGIKAMVWFDAEKDDEGDRNLAVTSSPETLAAFRKIAADPIFVVDVR